MQEDIDLRPYIRALIQRWWIIAVCALLAAAAAFIYLNVKEPQYRAMALVAVLGPSQRVQFDPRFEDVISQDTLIRAYPDLARSDELLQNVLGMLQTESIPDLPSLRKLLNVEATNSPNLLRMQVVDDDAALAARIANVWAEQFVTWANDVYGNQSASQLSFYQDQLTDAEARLNQAEATLADFQATNRLVIVANQLDSLIQQQANYLTRNRILDALAEDIQAVQRQLASDGPANALASQLTLLGLQSRAFSLQGSLPLSLELQAGELEAMSTGQQADYLANLAATLDEMSLMAETELAGIEPAILELQREKQALETELARYQQDVLVNSETFTALARKVDEELITTQDTSSGVRLASRASVPVYPSGTDALLLVAAATLAGVLIGATAIILWTWWRGA